MKNKKIKLNEKQKKELIKQLEKMAEENEQLLKRLLGKAGGDVSKINVVDRSKFMVKYMPEVMEELFKKYGTSKVLTDNDKIMKEGLRKVEERFHQELAKKKVKEWNIYYILLNCKIPKELSIDDNVTLISFGQKSCNDYLEIVNKLFYSFGPCASRSSEKIFEKGKDIVHEEYRKKNPLSILTIENVNATSEKEVYEETKDYANTIMLFLSFLTSSSIDLGGYIVEGKVNGFRQLHPTFTFTHYTPPYAEQITFEKVIKKLLKNIGNKQYLRIVLKYEKEALSEDKEEFRILKRWSVIEFVAEGYSQWKNSEDKILSKKNREKIEETIFNLIDKEKLEKSPRLRERTRSCVGDINHKNTKEKIRDLLNYVGYSTKNIGDSKDIIDIISQYRNCIVHHGGCYKEERISKVDCKGPKYCRESKIDLRKLNLELSHMIKQIIGFLLGVEFGYQDEVPDKVKKQYGED